MQYFYRVHANLHLTTIDYGRFYISKSLRRLGCGIYIQQCANALTKLRRFAWEVQQRYVIGYLNNQRLDQSFISRIQQGLNDKSIYAQYTVMALNRQDPQKRCLVYKGWPITAYYTGQ